MRRRIGRGMNMEKTTKMGKMSKVGKRKTARSEKIGKTTRAGKTNKIKRPEWIEKIEAMGKMGIREVEVNMKEDAEDGDGKSLGRVTYLLYFALLFILPYFSTYSN
ncbi:hypothetical protein BD779DRAFT_1587817 [Infundibulicybe gibba]|nr:hypothetical protein BD779DRAFT_1587817 [Infundibulicybe gibba]